MCDNLNECLINGKMIRDKSLLLEIIKHENYSMPFKIILKPLELLPNVMKSTIALINDDMMCKSLFVKLQDYIAIDEKETEAEIRRIKQAMNQRRQKAEKEFQLITTLISSCSDSKIINKSTLDSTKLTSIENVHSSFSITPPVTPENTAAQINFDQLPLGKMTNNINNSHHNQQYQHHAMNNDHNHREGISKHNNAIMQRQITRTINFEDDIFELDDGARQGDDEDDDTTKDENDRYHKYSDTENSDIEEMIVEKRPYARGRSASLANSSLARSAPICMPFMHHANAHLQDKHVNEQDIASSIKLLAKSIHADSIELFGELPSSRHVIKYNAEF